MSHRPSLPTKAGRIPIRAAREIAESYGYDQVIIVARAVGQGEHVTTYGKDRMNCAIAARIGDYLKYRVMRWKADENAHQD